MRPLAIILLLIILVLQYQLWFGEGSLVKVWQLRREIATQQAQNQSLKERNDALAGEVRDLKQGVEAVEERARTELGMIKDGETFYQVVHE
jgi:cell division protein FtsB